MHGLPTPNSGLAQFGLLVGVAYLLHEACGGAMAIARTVRAWWRRGPQKQGLG